jgi:signal transduction histidine kinase
MAHADVVTSGKTLGPAEGFTGLRPADLRYRVRRAALTFVSIGALITSVAATAASLQGVADSGVTSGNPGGRVEAVSRIGFGWAEGIRPGQTVDVLVAAGEPGGWRIETHDDIGLHVADGVRANARLRGLIGFGAAALVLAYLSVLFLRTRRRLVLPAAALAVLCATVPLEFQGSPIPSTIALGSAALLPVAVYTTRFTSWEIVRWVTTGLAAGLVGAWGYTRLNELPVYEFVEPIRANVALVGTLVVVAERVAVRAMTGQTAGILRPRLFDVVVVAGAAALAMFAGAMLRLEPIVTVVGLLVVLASVPLARQRWSGPMERLILGDVREQAAAEASEAERARLARELHDVPLQELAAVIRRLEILPGAEAESEDLRALAGHLRNVATELRPPVLDDLGLPAALEFLAGEATTEQLPVIANVIDDTGFGADRRPPTDVELAMYRIASEAVGNAVRHSGGTTIEVRANVAPDRVELAVRDDGAGLAPGAAREAARRKRLGLASMRRRAEAIDAELSIDGSARGTEVRVAWQA